MIINDMPGGGSLDAAGSATQPIYIDSNGAAQATTYALNKTVPSDAVFTDTTYSVATTSANGLMSASDKTKLDGMSSLPSVTSSDNGKVLTVVNGAWAKANTIGPTVQITTSPAVSGVTITGTLSGTSTTISAITDSNGVALLYPSSLGNWIFSGTHCISCSLSISSTTLYTSIMHSYSRIGGRIFYDNGDNEATYVFADSNYNILTTQTVAGLASAYYYAIISGTPTTDRWYVYDNTTHTQTIQSTSVTTTNGLASSLYWGYYETSTGVTTDSIGSGKTNTTTVLNMGVPTDYKPNIWAYIKYCRDNSLNGCSDWFIASKAEQDQLRSSGLVSWYSSNTIWSSVEYSSDIAYRWNYGTSSWSSLNYGKNSTFCAFAARAF